MPESTTQETNPSADLVLLPSPRRLQRLPGQYKTDADRYVLLAGNDPSLQRTGAIVQDAIAILGHKPELTAAAGRAPERIAAIIQIDPAQVAQREGYALTIRPDRITIVGGSPAGAFYGAMTLRQIARQAQGGALPCLHILDWPDFPNRGVTMDISRTKVPKMSTLFDFVDMLAEWKTNQFQLYTEHTFAYRDHRDVWEGASPMTGEDILALDAYCRERFIELVPSQNSFGHFMPWLRQPKYAGLAEAPLGMEFPWKVFLHAHNLCATDPRSIALLEGMYDELLPHFSSRQFNVGCDEALTGCGRSKEECDRRGEDRVYFEFVMKIHKLVQRHGRTMQMWGDIVLHHPKLIEELPEGIVALAWEYWPGVWTDRCTKFQDGGVPYYVCPSTNTFHSILGRTDWAMPNCFNAAAGGLKYGAIGFLNTQWGDGGHWAHLPFDYLGYAQGAAVSWCVEANSKLNMPRALDLHAFKDSAGVMGQLAWDLGMAYTKANVNVAAATIFNNLLLHYGSFGTEEEQAECLRTELAIDVKGPPILPQLLARVDADGGRKTGMGKATVEGLETAREYVAQLMQRLPQARMMRPDAEQIKREFANAAGLADHACRLGIARLNVPDRAFKNLPAGVRSDLAQQLEALVRDYRALWLARNRPGGLDVSVWKFDRLMELYRKK